MTTANDSSVGIEVIGAGLGRTGTLSLEEALHILGYHGTYHFVDFSHAAQWAQLANGKASIDSVIDMIVDDGYTVTMDNPTADIYQQLFHRYPEAKVILTVRDSPAKFAKSWKILFESIEVTEREFSWSFPSFFQWIPVFRQLKEMRCFMGTTHLDLPPCELLKNWKNHPEGWIEEQYERHNQDVIETIPSDQLLVFNVKQGWEPLCQFLEKPIPKAPFPHVKVNSAAGLQELRQVFHLVVYAWIPVILFSVAIVARTFVYCRDRRQDRQARRKTKKDT